MRTTLKNCFTGTSAPTPIAEATIKIPKTAMAFIIIVLELQFQSRDLTRQSEQYRQE